MLGKPIKVSEQMWPEESTPLVSISCITYNHVNFIRDAIEGFLMQETTFPVEILIHDDASTDGTVDIIREYAEKYPHLFKPIYQTENQYSKGVKISSTYNFPRAQGKYIALCEGDDYWTDPMKLQKQVEFLEENEDYSFSCHRFKLKDELSGLINDDQIANLSEWSDAGMIIDLDLFFKDWATQTLTMVIRNEYLTNKNHIKYKYYRDFHNVFYLLLNGVGYCQNFFGGIYRLHNGGIHSKVSVLEQQEILVLILNELSKQHRDLKKLYEYYNKSIEDLIHLYFNIGKRGRYIMLMKYCLKNKSFKNLFEYAKNDIKNIFINKTSVYK